MRYIKFRAWNGKGLIHSGDTDLKLYVEARYGRPYLLDRDQYGEWRMMPAYWELMQYTGLRDKNGVEIYERDIVIDTRDKTTQEVRWYRGGFMLQTKGHFGFHDIERHDGDCKLFEVIGNIWENPELLK